MIQEEEKVHSIIEYEELLIKYSKSKIEYFNGEIIMNSHTSDRYNAITTNIIAKLKPFFRGSKCKVRSEQIEVILKDEKEEIRAFPDVFVSCDSEMKGNSYSTIP